MSSLDSEEGKPARREGEAREERGTSSNEERVEMRDGRRQPHPQSCTLEQLYHEALPLEKALSHSGPPTFPTVGSAISLGSTEEAASVISFTSSVHRYFVLWEIFLLNVTLVLAVWARNGEVARIGEEEVEAAVATLEPRRRTP